ncbi:MAG: glycosyltransferase family 4 protein [Bacillota bacterium]
MIFYRYINRLIIPFIFALTCGVFLTPVSMYLAKLIGAVDFPKDERKIHKKPIPRLGGTAIFIAVFLGMLIFSNYLTNIKIGIILGGIIIVLTGILDDIYTLSAKTKLFLQILSAIVVVGFGVRIEIFTDIFNNSKYIYLGMLSFPVTVFWIVGITNTVNLIDGLDGLAAGTAIIASISLIYISLINNRIETAILLVLLTGATFGFLPYNFNPAKVFMGDCGSLFLGYFLAVTSILGAVKSATVVTYLLPIVVLGLPIFDTSFAILRRYINKKPIMEPDRGHLHHRLLDIGLKHKQAVLVLYLISLLLGSAATFYFTNRYIISYITITLVGIIVFIPISQTSDI